MDFNQQMFLALLTRHDPAVAQGLVFKYSGLGSTKALGASPALHRLGYLVYHEDDRYRLVPFDIGARGNVGEILCPATWHRDAELLEKGIATKELVAINLGGSNGLDAAEYLFSDSNSVDSINKWLKDKGLTLET